MKTLMFALIFALPAAAQLPVSATPAATQKIVQPAGTSLNVNVLNQVLYVDPTSSTDLVTQVNMLLSGCGAGRCVVRIPNRATCYSVASGTIRVTHPNQSIEGDGAESTCISYAGDTFLNVSMAAAFTIANAGHFGGFTVNCTAAAASCVAAGDVVHPIFHDIALIGPGSTSSTAFIFRNSAGWLERWVLRDVSITGFGKNLHFMAPVGAGKDSYGYGSIDNLQTNQTAGTSGIVVDAGASVYHMSGLKMSVNTSGTTSGDTIFRVAGIINGTGLSLTGETAGSVITAVTVAPAGQFVFEGDFSVYGSTNINNVAAGGIYYVGAHADSGDLKFTRPTGTIANYANAGIQAEIYPMYSAGGWASQLPGYVAHRGYAMDTKNGATSPFNVFDARMPMCDAVLTGASFAQPISKAINVHCIDGSGQVSRPSRVPAGVQSYESYTSNDETTYVHGANIGNRVFGNAAEVLEGIQDGKRTIGRLTCQSISVPVNGAPVAEAVRVCAGPDNAEGFDTSGRLYLQYSNGENWVTGLVLSRSLGAKFGAQVSVPFHTPGSSSEACTTGQLAYDANYDYTCTAPNTWKRTALSSF